jgi:hypothetical protein
MLPLPVAPKQAHLIISLHVIQYHYRDLLSEGFQAAIFTLLGRVKKSGTHLSKQPKNGAE